MQDVPDELRAYDAPSDEWPDTLDAPVAACDHHTHLFENDRGGVLDTCIKPGDETPVHTHRWPAKFSILSVSPFLRFDAHRTALLESHTMAAFDNPPPAIRSDPLPPHSLRNIGDADIRIISVELKG